VLWWADVDGARNNGHSIELSTSSTSKSLLGMYSQVEKEAFIPVGKGL
jgi:hypothetical protein